MRKKRKTYMAKFRSYFFEAYYLNKFKNFIPPLECDDEDCPDFGTDKCKSELAIECEEISDAISFAIDFLNLEETGSAAVFLHCFNEEMFAVVKSDMIDGENAIGKTEDEINITVFHASDFDKDFFAEIDATYQLICYGLLIEKEPTQWRVVSD